MVCRSATTASPCRVGQHATALIPKGAKNVEVGKDFIKYFIQPKVNDEYLKVGLARFPGDAANVTNDPWWTDPKGPAPASLCPTGPVDPTVPYFWAFNPACAEAQNQHVWGVALADT